MKVMQETFSINRIETALPTKDERHDEALMMVRRLKDNYSALQIHVMLKHFTEMLSDAIDLNKEDALSQIPSENGKNVPQTVFGAVVSAERGRRTWAYPENDTELVRLTKALDTAKTDLKDRQTLLQKMKAPLVDPATGEMVMPAECMSDGLILKVELPS